MAQSSPRSLIAHGRILDRLAQSMGFKRKRYFYIFKESDRRLRERMVSWFREIRK